MALAPVGEPERTPAAPAAMLVSGGEGESKPDVASVVESSPADVVDQTPPPAAAPPAAPAVREDTGPGTILLVEDEEAVRAFASRALISRGYTVLEAGSGVEALEVMAEHGGTVDLVVSTWSCRR